ncbi:hypothetical protein [Solitalea koreensis]|uniref:Cytochrome c domain-containing protein n=1 Tax=Solitalea koreensis TaxID=543615 RepID=A0A521C9S6_9SPHI|nr:hypothetical protein [Solitalea koreensis]SMO56134.1 hypothetical protein SAMN06265350_103326 [Solitalea koreensis]
MKKLVFLLIGAEILYMGCSYMAAEQPPDNQTNCTPRFPNQQVTYNNYVKRIVANNCTITCHRGGDSQGTGNFTTYAGIRQYTPDIFYFRVVQDRADMPQGNAPLPKSVRDSLDIWIKNCSPEN